MKCRICTLSVLVVAVLVGSVRSLGVDDSDVGVSPTDPRFSENACIIVADYTVPDCSRQPPDRIIPPDAPENPCPGCPEDPTNSDTGEQVGGGTQILYEQLEDALDNCPYDPVLIEIAGTLYVSNDAYFWYNQTKDLIVRGLTETVVSGGHNVTILVATNVTVFDPMLNETMTEEQLVEQTVMAPLVEQEFFSAIVGFKDMQVLHQNISVTLDTVLLEGCATERPLFLTFVKPERCTFPDPAAVCCGAYFPTDAAEHISLTGVCQRTGASFDGYRALIANGPLELWDNNDDEGEAASEAEWAIQTQLTLEMWIRPGRTSDYRAGIAGNYLDNDDNDDGGFGFQWLGTEENEEEDSVPKTAWRVAQFGLFGDSLVAPTPYGQWTHVAGVFEAGQEFLYVNGNLQGSQPRAQADIDYTNPRVFTIGVINAGYDDEDERWFEGDLDEVRVWTEARSQAQIQANMRRAVDPTLPQLRGYWRFDLPRGAEPDLYENNLVAHHQSNPQVDVTAYVRSGAPHSLLPAPLPVCLCAEPDGLCTATNLQQEHPPDAIVAALGETCNQDSAECQFLHGMAIDPNTDPDSGEYFGALWLTGLKQSSGPAFNRTERFVPGRFVENFSLVPTFNATANTTTFELVADEVPRFVPGAVGSTLPPAGADGGSPWWLFPLFLPGWFANNGAPPYTAMNFYPGLFVNVTEATGTYGVPVPDGWTEQDLVFVPGLELVPGVFVPYANTDPLYVVPVNVLGGFTFNLASDTDACVVPEAPLGESAVAVGPVLEEEFGCLFGAGDPEPQYLAPGERDPCFVLAHIRAALPAGTELLPAEDVLGCTVTADDPEPEYLDPRERDPCFVLRELRELARNQTSFAANCTLHGGVPLPELYMPCLKNQNVSVLSATVQNYHGERVLCQHACDERVTLRMERSKFTNTPGTALWSSGLEHYDVHDNVFCPCGGFTDECVYLNANHVTRGQFAVYNNRHCAVEDLLPVACDYDMTGTLRCQNGELFCLDIAETIVKDCQQVEISPGVVVFDSDCAVYTPCACQPRYENVTLANGQVVEQELFGGSVTIDIPFLTPVLADITGGNSTLELSCPLRNQTFEYNYECAEERIIQVPMDPPFQNLTMNVTITVVVNCTETRVFLTSAGADALECPCPIGFDPDVAHTNGTVVGSQAGAGIYSECAWSLPANLGYLPGEQCLDGIVQCPYAGGQLGDGGPPPPQLGECTAGGTALVECSVTTCVGGLLDYEGVQHACDLSTGLCASDSVLQVPCQCTAGHLTVTCDRITCVPAVPCAPGGGLCEYLDGTLTAFDGEQYQCAVLVNETACVSATFVATQPVPGTAGLLVVPCTNNYVVPESGPCSCAGAQQIGADTGNGTLALPGTVDANSTDAPVDTGDLALQLTCLATGQLRCRCDGVHAVQVPLPENRTLNENACAYKIDNVPWDAQLWFQQSNVAQQLPFGWCFERVTWDLIAEFPLKVLHFFSGHGVQHESARLSPLVTGTVQDWRDGHPDQWNRRYCNDGCHQPRPTQLSEACVVDPRYGLQTPEFGVLRYDRIQSAHDNCEFAAVIVHKGENVYEERLDMHRDNFWLGTYDMAVIVQSGMKIRANNVTVRGFHFVHPNADKRPIISPAGDVSFFDSADDDDAGIVLPSNFTLMNNLFSGDGVNDAGALVGGLEFFFKMYYNTFENFFTRTVDIQAESVEVELNTWRLCTGRAFRGRDMVSYRWEENLLEECVGISAANDMDIVSLEARGDMGRITPQDSFDILFAQLFGSQPIGSDLFAVVAVNPDRGCNNVFNPSYVCYVRGNRQTVSNDQPDQSSILYRLIGGSIPLENVRDNTGNHARICMHVSGNPVLDIGDKSELYKQNALCKTRDSRQVQDEAYDFGFQSPGSLITFGCAFPDCLDAAEPYPEMEVTPRCDLNLVDDYGFACINNVTECSRHALELNRCHVISGQARLRRERMQFWRNTYVQGAEDDFPCCDKPVIYEDQHLFAADRTILDYLELRFEIETVADENGERLFYTLQEFNAQQLHFYRLCMDGRYTIRQHRLRVADLYMREEDGDFRMEDCRIYNWWHYPEDTQLGFVDDPRGAVPVVILPDGTIYFTERSPNVDGFYVYFTPHRRIRLSPFVVPEPVRPTPQQFVALQSAGSGSDAAALRDAVLTTNPRIQQQVAGPLANQLESSCVLLRNYAENLDGRVFTVVAPANYELRGNHIVDCGMRQYGEVCTFMVEGSADSFGSYEMEDNYITQRKSFLWATGGSEGSHVRIACYEVHGFGQPSVWTFRNNTCRLLENEEDEGVVATTAELAEADVADSDEAAPRNQFTLQALTSRRGVNLLGLDQVDPDSIEQSDISVEAVVGTPLYPRPGALGGFVPLEQSQNVAEQSSEQVNNGRGVYAVRVTSRGHTVGLRLYDIGANTISLTQTAGRISDMLFPYFQPDLQALRVLAAELNSLPAQELLANGTYTIGTMPTNWPWGLNGMQADIIYCGEFADLHETMFSECAVCDDGCPVAPPARCIVDPQNSTFVEGNPFFGRWVFTSIDEALLHCVDPTRTIELRRQPTPYTQAINVQTSDWTLYSDDGAEIYVQVSPVQLNADSITFRNLVFLHRAGSAVPTVRNGLALGRPPKFVTFQNCTLDGQNLTTTAAISGQFDTLAVEDCEFRGYTGARVVDVSSDCGAVFVENSLFRDATGSALRLVDFDEAVVRRNTFERCGGGHEDELACVYVRTCVSTVFSVVIAGNEQWQDFSGAHFDVAANTHTQTANGYVASYWLDGLPLADPNVTFAMLDLSGNRAAGLPVGMRASRMDDLSLRSSAELAVLSKRANVQYLYITQRNLFVSGQWHHIVVGEPRDDHTIDADPEGTMHLYCDQGCSGSVQNVSLVMTLSMLVFAAAVYLYVTCYYRIAKAPRGMRYSEGLGVQVPRRANEFGPYADFKLDERRSQQQYARRQRAAAEAAENAGGGDAENFLEFE